MRRRFELDSWVADATRGRFPIRGLKAHGYRQEVAPRLQETWDAPVPTEHRETPFAARRSLTHLFQNLTLDSL